MIFFEHYSQVPKKIWRWKNFTPHDMRCRCCGALLLVPHAMDSLQFLRDSIREPLNVNCGYRCPFHNARVGGAPMSEHKKGTAFDIRLTNRYGNIGKERLYRAALEAGFTGFGLNYNTFIHIDKGRVRSW